MANKSAQNESAELLVIGAGPAGYPAAFHAADLGMSVTIVDPEVNPGGVCLYRGCVPSKALLHVAEFVNEAEGMAKLGVELGDVNVDVGRLRDWKNSVVKRLTGGLGQLCKQRKIKYVRGRAHLLGPHSAAIQPHEGGETRISFDNAIVATGSVPGSVPGLPDSNRVMSSREALDIADVPERLLVVGAGYIGLELGQVYASLGSRVSVVEMLPEILPGADRDLAKFLARRLKKQFESIMTETKAANITETDNGLDVTFDGKESGSDRFDKIMVAVGRKPYTADAGFGNTRAAIDEHGFVVVDEQRRTAEPSIYAVGDISGQPMLAHKGTHEAHVAVDAIAGEAASWDSQTVPAVVFSDPAVAWCGLTEREAGEQGIDIETTTFPWAASGRATTLARNDGVTKLVLEPGSNRILGVGIAGKDAGELIAEGTLAVEMGALAEDIALTVHAHPTLAETLMEAAEAADGHSTHYFGR